MIFMQKSTQEAAVDATTVDDVALPVNCDNNNLDGNRNPRGGDDDQCNLRDTEIAGKTIHFEVLSRFTNNLTVDVDDSELAHHHDVLTTMSPLSVSGNGNNNNNNNNNNHVIGSNSSTIEATTPALDNTLSSTTLSTAQGSDESTVTSSSSENTNRASSQPSYDKEPDGTIKPYVNLEELTRILEQYPEIDRMLDNM